jgi:hypothetical protein
VRESLPNFTPAIPVNNSWPSSSPDQTDPMRANFVSPSGAKRERLGTSRFVIIPSLAVFDRVKPKDLPRAPNLMRETDGI